MGAQCSRSSSRHESLKERGSAARKRPCVVPYRYARISSTKAAQFTAGRTDFPISRIAFDDDDDDDDVSRDRRLEAAEERVLWMAGRSGS